jgi:drug/metabolite transporter (DMT)-like permease
LSAPPAPATDGGPRAAAAFLGCSTIWGSTFLVIRLGDEALPPLWAASLRLALASLLLLLVARLMRQPLPRGRARVAALQYGFLNMGLSFCLLYWAELVVPSGVTAVFYATIPLSTAILARAFGLERVPTRRWLAATIAFAGVALLVSGQLGRSVPLLPLLGLLIATLCASLSGIALKAGPPQSSLGANAIACAIGFAVCLVASVIRREPHPWPTTPGAALPVVYLALAGSMGAFVLYAWLIHRWPVTRTSFVSVLVPIIATTLGVAVRHEAVTAAGLMGTALVLLGVGLTALPEPPVRAPAGARTGARNAEAPPEGGAS